jgi:uncharacterized membrane protein YtjA (UPF0391 family)
MFHPLRPAELTGHEPRCERVSLCLQEINMFGWAITFLIIALIAGALGFGVVAGTAFAAAKIVFVVALLAFLVSAVLGYSRRYP